MKYTINKKIIFSYIFFLIVILFFIKYIWGNLSDIKDITIVFKPTLLFLSIGIWCISYAGYSLIWRNILLSIDKNIKISKVSSFKIYTLTEFSKYIPGSVWSVFARTYFSNILNTQKRHILTASTIDALLSATTIITLGSLFLILYFSEAHIFLILIALTISLAGFILLHPKVFYFISNVVLQKMGKEKIDPDSMLSYKKIVYFSLQYILLNIIQAISFYCLIISITPVNLNDFFIIGASFCLGIGLGIIAFFAPSGIGVREGVMTYLLSLIVSSPIATLIALVSRIWMTFGEIILLIFSISLEKFQKLRKKE